MKDEEARKSAIKIAKYCYKHQGCKDCIFKTSETETCMFKFYSQPWRLMLPFGKENESFLEEDEK